MKNDFSTQKRVLNRALCILLAFLMSMAPTFSAFAAEITTSSPTAETETLGSTDVGETSTETTEATGTTETPKSPSDEAATSPESTPEKDADDKTETAPPSGDSSSESSETSSEGSSSESTAPETTDPETPADKEDADGEKDADVKEEDKDEEEEKEDEKVQIIPPEEKEEIEIEEISISTAEELVAFAERVNSGDSMENTVVTVKANINLSSVSPWVPIGSTVDTPFCGTFDGANKTISNIKTDDDSYGGLFGFLAGADIKNVNLKKVNAKNSTQGLFFAAANTEFTNCFVKSGFLGLQKRAVAFALPVVTPWDGTEDDFWYTSNPGANVYVISTAEELAGLGLLVNTGTNFAGVTIILDSSVDLDGSTSYWPAIGTSSNSFQGTFQVLGDNVIMNMSSNTLGLFGTINNAVIKNVFLYNANIDTTAPVGAIATTAADSAIQNCTVSNSNIKSSNIASGILSTMGYSGRPGFVTQCLVENSVIQGSTATGIINNLYNYATSQNIIYGTKFISNNSAGVAFSASGPSGTYASISENIVLNTEFNGSNAAGIIRSISGWNATTNNFISDVTFTGGGTLGTAGTPNGVDSYFTDSELNLPLVSNGTFVANNYWDNSVTSSRPEISGKTESYSTAYLTNGEFNVNTSYWRSEKNYYPRLSALSNSANKSMKSLTGLASLAVLMEDPEDTYSGTKGIILVNKTPEGDAITWNYSSTTLSQKPAVDALGAVYGTILYNEDNAPVVINDLVATIADPNDINPSYEKNFPAITLLDVLLKEDESARVPVITSTELAPATATTSLKPTLVYFDDIEINANAGIAYLEISMGGGSWSAVSLVDCSSASSNFTLNAATKTVTFDFTDYSSMPPVNPLQPGSKYRVVIPAGAVKELNKENYNKEIIMYFEIAAIQAPVVNVLTTPGEFVVGETIGQNALATWFNVTNMGATLTFTGSDLTPVPTSWVLADPSLTVANITTQLRTTVTPPSNTDVKIYYWADVSFTTPLTTHGYYNVYIFALNSDSRTSYKRIRVSVQGTRAWLTAPTTHQHMLWSNDPSQVEFLVENTLKAVYTDASGAQVNADISVSVNPTMWTSNVTATSADAFMVDVIASVLDKSGSVIPSTTTTIQVYLDRNTTASVASAYVSKYAPATQAEVEALIAATVTDATNYTLSYNHDPLVTGTPNNYANPNRYPVIVTFNPTSATTVCTTPGHSSATPLTVNYIVDILAVPETSGADVLPFWEQVKEDAKTSNDYIRVDRTHTPSDMPSGVLTVLREHQYNNLKLDLGKYRWNFYGHAVKEQPVWRVAYPLDLNFEDNAKVTKLIEGYKGVQFTFAIKGKLYADVGLDIWTNGNAGEVWTLYAYNKDENKLEFVSDAIMDGHWAQTLIDYAQDTTYVVSTLPYESKDEEKFAEPQTGDGTIVINGNYNPGYTYTPPSATQPAAPSTTTPSTTTPNTENENGTTNNTENSTDVPTNAVQTPALNLGAVLGAGAAGGALLLGAVVIRKKSQTKGE